MGYDPTEPVALCDGCGQGLREGDEAWGLAAMSASAVSDCGLSFNQIERLEEWSVHYCCISPCLEKAVVAELRKLRKTS